MGTNYCFRFIYLPFLIQPASQGAIGESKSLRVAKNLAVTSESDTVSKVLTKSWGIQQSTARASKKETSEALSSRKRVPMVWTTRSEMNGILRAI